MRIGSGQGRKHIGSLVMVLETDEMGIGEDEIMALFPPHAASGLNFAMVDDDGFTAESPKRLIIVIQGRVLRAPRGRIRLV